MAVEHALVLLQLEVGVFLRQTRTRGDTLRLIERTTVAISRTFCVESVGASGLH
jgi:hypothetical protein